jgi:hypothetical protein
MILLAKTKESCEGIRYPQPQLLATIFKHGKWCWCISLSQCICVTYLWVLSLWPSSGTLQGLLTEANATMMMRTTCAILLYAIMFDLLTFKLSTAAHLYPILTWVPTSSLRLLAIYSSYSLTDNLPKTLESDIRDTSRTNRSSQHLLRLLHPWGINKQLQNLYLEL